MTAHTFISCFEIYVVVVLLAFVVFHDILSKFPVVVGFRVVKGRR